jgi:hypothetical protein
MFGGHEVKDIVAVKQEDGTSKQVCGDPLCCYEAGIIDYLSGKRVYIRRKTAQKYGTNQWVIKLV